MKLAIVAGRLRQFTTSGLPRSSETDRLTQLRDLALLPEPPPQREETLAPWAAQRAVAEPTSVLKRWSRNLSTRFLFGTAIVIASAGLAGGVGFVTYAPGTTRTSASQERSGAADEAGLKARYADARRNLELAANAKDHADALAAMLKLANAGYGPALFQLAILYERGDGVTQDRSKAASFYEKALSAGQEKAAQNLAAMKLESSSPADQEYGEQLTRRAAYAGIRDAQYNAGVLAAKRKNDPEQLLQAWAWFSLAAQQGDAEAAQRRAVIEAALTPEQIVQANRQLERIRAANAPR